MLLRLLIHQWLRNAAAETLRNAAAQQNIDPKTGEPVDPPPRKPCDVGFVFAMGVECGGLVDCLTDPMTTRGRGFIEHAGGLGERHVLVMESGVGREHARVATEELIALDRPAWIISAGFAGGLHSDLKRGHILMANGLVDLDDHQLSIDFKIDEAAIAATQGLHVGRLLTVDRIIREPEEKRKLGENHNALGVDMETMAVAQICHREKIRFMSVRVISDTVDDQLAPELERLIAQDTTAGRLGTAAGAIFRRPGIAKEMWKLKEDAMKASDRLAKFLQGVVPQLDGK